MKYINELKKEELNNKKILLRVDFDVPLTQSPTTNPEGETLSPYGAGRQSLTKIGDNFRIKAQKETIDYLISFGAKVLLVGHLGHDVSGASFGPIVEELGEILGQTLTLVPHSELDGINPERGREGTQRASALYGVDKLFGVGPLLLLDNIRQNSREIQNNEELAVSLSNGFDYYVNDAFAVMHRNHASVVAITRHLPSFAGFLIKKETESLRRALEAPVDGKVLVLGGAKISTKLPVIKNFLDKAEKILIGGAVANNFFKARGINVGASMVDNEFLLDVESEKIILPEDVLISEDKTGDSGAETSPIENIDSSHLILDIGPETAKHYAEIIKTAKMVIWNGPMGLSEVEVFAEGTRDIAKAVASAAKSIVGGGDTVAAVDKLDLLDRYSFVSTGGGAMLEFLAGNRLPGLEVLDYYKN
ncbi:MAG: phosphoglycerate kinase [Candidatus Yanofskybacteria bacterium]|nr:phosphoglycerate kinase [Candidatus Yanofskybacteria bacterium]